MTLWKQRDPIAKAERLLRERGLLTDPLVERIQTRVMERVDDATHYAQRAPNPRPEEALHPVFAR